MWHRRTLLSLTAALGAAALACSGGSGGAVPAEPLSQTAEPTAEPAPEPTITPRPSPEPSPQKLDGDLSLAMRLGWKTDFSRHSVPYGEIIAGGPSRDKIPPIDEPKFIPVADAPGYLRDAEPVISVEINGAAKAYPLGMMMKHEVANDELGGVPITVTFCPLCNTAIVFDRRVNGTVLDFGVTGNLRNSDLIMWDRQTESWWQQITGEAIVGDLTDMRLKFIPASVVSWAQFRDGFPQGQVLSRDTGYRGTYDLPSYGGIDGADKNPSHFRGATDPRLKPMERVVGISLGDEDAAYPFGFLKKQPVINDSVGGESIVVFYTGGTLSPFGTYVVMIDIVGPVDYTVVGSTAVYEPFVDGEKLTFNAENDVIVDQETGSIWDILGHAVSGPLKGSRLEPVVHGNHFWFSWASFNPETTVRAPEDYASGAAKPGPRE